MKFEFYLCEEINIITQILHTLKTTSQRRHVCVNVQAVFYTLRADMFANLTSILKLN